MPEVTALGEIDERIAAARENLSELMEQATAASGAADEARTADRIAEQQALLDDLIKQREALVR
ncbi:hypothetical protein EZH22_27080 [Xanthobacter dioxanivorans]|uniref:Uncharacterized protein n=1 Tax=Xanthobacter dioxanivorans TaxID=2528964 RepID=A0A974SHQ9_9HYPH|nr:hypothetical protein [Xanthobacter dioxanivorans]QRG06551.1 hypothetical protein EZH22_27080 [Xanthobacter dioxanivorans]